MTTRINWDDVRARITTAMDGRSMRDFGGTAGVDHATLSKFLGGKQAALAIEVLERIAEEIGTPAPVLMYGPGTDTPAAANGVREIPLDKIQTWTGNPRKSFDAAELQGLADSIAARGVLQPIIVRPSPPTPNSRRPFEIVAGERRFRAAGMAGLTLIPAILRDVSDTDMLVDAVIENLQRSNVTPMEEARAFAALSKDHGLSAAEIARQIGQSPRQVQQRIALISRLCAEAQTAIEEGRLRPSYARALTQAPAVMQSNLLGRILAQLPGWDSEEAITASIAALLPPESAALPGVVEDYERSGGALVGTTQGHRRFADPEIFAACQLAAIGEEITELQSRGTVYIGDERGEAPRWRIIETIQALHAGGKPHANGPAVHAIHIRDDGYLTATTYGPFREPYDNTARQRLGLELLSTIDYIRYIIADQLDLSPQAISAEDDISALPATAQDDIWQALDHAANGSLDHSPDIRARLTTPRQIAAWLETDEIGDDASPATTSPARLTEPAGRLEGGGDDAGHNDDPDLFGAASPSPTSQPTTQWIDPSKTPHPCMSCFRLEQCHA